MTAADPVVAALRAVLPAGAVPDDPDVVRSYASFDWCTIGGDLSTDAGGLCCVKYGVTSDFVRVHQEIEAALDPLGILNPGRAFA